MSPPCLSVKNIKVLTGVRYLHPSPNCAPLQEPCPSLRCYFVWSASRSCISLHAPRLAASGQRLALKRLHQPASPFCIVPTCVLYHTACTLYQPRLAASGSLALSRCLATGMVPTAVPHTLPQSSRSCITLLANRITSQPSGIVSPRVTCKSLQKRMVALANGMGSDTGENSANFYARFGQLARKYLHAWPGELRTVSRWRWLATT